MQKLIILALVMGVSFGFAAGIFSGGLQFEGAAMGLTAVSLISIIFSAVLFLDQKKTAKYETGL